MSEAEQNANILDEEVKQEKQRTVVNITTSATQFHQEDMSAYGASNEALVHLMGHVPSEYGRRGVHVRDLHPGHIYSKLLERHGMAKGFWPWDSRKCGFLPFSDTTFGVFMRMM